MNTKPVPQHFFKAPLFRRGVEVRCLAAAILLCGCQPNNPSDPGEQLHPLRINVENGAQYSTLIDTVKAVTDYDYPVASAPYGNGTFTLNLPTTLPDKELDSIAFIMPPFETVGIPTAMATMLYIEAFKQGEPVGSIEISTGSPADLETVADGANGIYVYVDRNVDITGLETVEDGGEIFSVNIALHFKKGWNRMYAIWNSISSTSTEEYIHTLTTTPPDGIKWYYMSSQSLEKSDISTAKSTTHHQYSVVPLFRREVWERCF